jgi:hypothetical protein
MKGRSVDRTPTYLGPGVDIEVNDLASYERRGGFIIEPKVDGMWCELTVGDPDRGKPHRLNSRDGTTEPISGSNLGDIHLQTIPLPEHSIIIGELEAATEWAVEQAGERGFRRLHLFDIIRIGDQFLHELPWVERKGKLNGLCCEMNTWRDESRFVNVEVQYDSFEKRYHEWIEFGYEGVVLKPPQSVYSTHRSDGKTDQWIRCKRWVTGDYVLCGLEFTPGGKYKGPELTGAWGLYKNGKLERVMKAAPPDPSLLRKENIGKLVVEFKGWAKFRSGALRHAQAIRVRMDKGPRSCTL